jgi:hypothetical protein
MEKPAARVLAALALPMFGCANVVLLPGENPDDPGSSGVGGAGGGNGTQVGTTTTGVTTTTDKPGWDGCPSQCKDGAGSTTCGCTVSCSGLSKIACAPIVDLQGNSKIECVCTYEELFSGVCYETNPSATCDPHAGCCFKYFQSTE